MWVKLHSLTHIPIMWVWSILGLVWCYRECPPFISEFVDMDRYICLCIIPSFVCICVSKWVSWVTPKFPVRYMLRPEKQLSIKFIILQCVLCEIWAEAEETAQSIAQQPYGGTLMRLMHVWSRNKERDQAAHHMMGLWLVYIYMQPKSHVQCKAFLWRRSEVFF